MGTNFDEIKVIIVPEMLKKVSLQFCPLVYFIFVLYIQSRLMEMLSPQNLLSFISFALRVIVRILW